MKEHVDPVEQEPVLSNMKVRAPVQRGYLCGAGTCVERVLVVDDDTVDEAVVAASAADDAALQELDVRQV